MNSLGERKPGLAVGVALATEDESAPPEHPEVAIAVRTLELAVERLPDALVE